MTIGIRDFFDDNEPVMKSSMEDYFRSILLAIGSKIKPLSPSSSLHFEFAMELDDGLRHEDIEALQHDQPSSGTSWIIDESKMVCGIVPIVSYCTDSFKIELNEHRP